MKCIRASLFFSLTVFLVAVLFNPISAKDAKALIEKMVAEVGGREGLYKLRDVEYKFIYHDLQQDKRDASIERYVFDGELSWAKYLEREMSVVPSVEGEMIQGYDGKETWVTIEGKLVEDSKILRMADFLRKTNYYWFTMMFKLLDPGLNYQHAGTRTVDGVEYDMVKITFDHNVGDVQDTYLLYINPKTHLVDQFLFTVLDFGVTEPSLMTVEYEEIEGLKLPTRRKYVKANWEGVPQNDRWIDEISKDIKFQNGFKEEMFEKPTK